MYSIESFYWMSLASNHRDTYKSACYWAGKLLSIPRRYNDGLHLFGLAYYLSVARDNQKLKSNMFGQANYGAGKLIPLVFVPLVADEHNSVNPYPELIRKCV
jgi:hypothetical protein